MIKIPHNKLNFCQKSSNDGKTALRKISKFNFIKDRAAVLLLDSSIFEKAIFTIIDDNPYLFCRFMDKETWNDTRILVGAFDVLQIEDIGFTYTVNKEQTEIWRKIMLTQYGENYKKALIEILNKRKFEAYQHYQDQINELNN